tara:strand:+ start:650 stop:1534 length:885 start_codon:yes stop_codon:yes gene_type:complete
MTEEYTYQWTPYDDKGNFIEDGPTLKVTKSSLNTFYWCNKQYEFNYIEKRPQDTSDAMLKGTIVHNAYEDFYKCVDVDAIEEYSKDELQEYFISLFPVDEYGYVYDTICALEADRYIRSKEFTEKPYLPAGNEVRLNARYTVEQNVNPKYPLMRDYTVHLQGIIDRIFEEDGEYILMELKTGIWKDSKMSGMRSEMAYYKLLMEQASDEEMIANGLDPNIPITHWGWFYPDSNFLFVENCVKASQTAMRKKFSKLIESYEQNSFPASYYYKKCVHCAYMPICEAAIENQLFDDW